MAAYMLTGNESDIEILGTFFFQRIFSNVVPCYVVPVTNMPENT